jgi:hypothetical protein
VRRWRARFFSRARAHGGNLVLGFWRCSHLAANVVEDLIGVKIAMRIHPGTGFDPRDFQACARQRQHGDSTCGAESNHRNID